MPEKPFEAVRFLDELEAYEVADYQVFMSFVNDEDALAFREWWEQFGAVGFQRWLELPGKEKPHGE